MPCADLLAWLEDKERVPVVAVPVNFDVEEFTDTLSFAVL
jgi:hypothetical protein